MESLGVIGPVISLAGTMFAIIFAYMAFLRNKKTDDRAEAKQIGVVMAELGYIKSGIDDIKRKHAEQEQKYVDIVTRLVKVEDSAKLAHHKIYELKNLRKEV